LRSWQRRRGAWLRGGPPADQFVLNLSAHFVVFAFGGFELEKRRMCAFIYCRRFVYISAIWAKVWGRRGRAFVVNRT
jgi:hypothetical protein